MSPGSSPRVRGTALVRAGLPARKRFIPACAGNSSNPRPAAPCLPVHPRVCGEQRMVITTPTGKTGSSPRVRGTVLIRAERDVTSRFIPACAGNRTPSTIEPCASSVHPRVCGEQPGIGLRHFPGIGSSPRVRGTGTADITDLKMTRFIPACAGNRVAACRSTRFPAVHPRVCGEQSLQKSRRF